MFTFYIDLSLQLVWSRYSNIGAWWSWSKGILYVTWWSPLWILGFTLRWYRKLPLPYYLHFTALRGGHAKSLTSLPSYSTSIFIGRLLSGLSNELILQRTYFVLFHNKCPPCLCTRCQQVLLAECGLSLAYCWCWSIVWCIENVDWVFFDVLLLYLHLYFIKQ